ncbi:MAG: polymerase sigma factor RpoE [Labilithrix sp.]|nr:polymerase sigma factor RpoE [Labilithrix sp.]
MPQAADFRVVFRREFSWVWNTLRRLGVRSDDLKDQSQEVFLRVHQLLSDYDTSRPFRPWLFAIAYRVAGRYRTTHARHPVMEPVDLADDGPGPDEDLETKQAQALVLDALQTIELNRRAVFILAELEERPVPEIAETLGVPLNTAYSRLRVAREEFAQAVARIRLRGERA